MHVTSQQTNNFRERNVLKDKEVLQSIETNGGKSYFVSKFIIQAMNKGNNLDLN